MQARSIKNQLNRKTTQSSTAPKIFMALAMFMEQAKATADAARTKLHGQLGEAAGAAATARTKRRNAHKHTVTAPTGPTPDPPHHLTVAQSRVRRPGHFCRRARPT